MSDTNERNPSIDEDAQDAQGRHAPIPNNTTHDDLANATSSSTEALELSQSASPIGTVPLSPYSWPQPPRDRPSTGERASMATRRLPAAIRAAFTGTHEGEVAAEPQQEPQEAPPMIDQRPGGEFDNADALRPKSRKMEWTAENDRSLLLFGFGRDISGVECKAIADWFPEKPTAKAVQERLTKLRAAGRKVLKESGIFDADALRDTPTVSRAPSVVQTATPSQQRSTRRHTVNINTGTAPPIPSRSPVSAPASQRLEHAATAVTGASPFTPVFHPLRRRLAQPPTLMSQPNVQPYMGPPRGLSYPSCQHPYPGMSRGMEEIDAGIIAGLRKYVPDRAEASMQRYYPLPTNSGQRPSTIPGHYMLPPGMPADQQQLSRTQGQHFGGITTAPANASSNGGEVIDELRRSEMELQSKRARQTGRRQL